MIKCWHYRRVVSRCVDDLTPLPSLAQAHLAHCPECRRHAAIEVEIVRRLTGGAAAQKSQPPPDFLSSRIMARITTASPHPRPALGLSLLRWPAGIATVLLLAAFLFWPNAQSQKVAAHPTVRGQTQPHPQPVAALELPSPQVLAQWAIRPDQPLQTEMQAVLYDARRAMTALTENFFPEKLRQTLLATAATSN